MVADESRSAERSAEPHEGHLPHHRVHVLSLAGKPGAALALPLAFSVPVRVDLIRRAVVAAQSRRRQPHGTTRMAGLQHSVEWAGKGRGVARTPRLMSGMRGAQAPNTVGGRPAHPPRVATIWAKKINTQERRLAFAAALAATRELERVRARGHRVPDGVHLPLVLEDPLEEIDSASDAIDLLLRLKLSEDLERTRSGVRRGSGRARRRGRGRHVPRGPLVVTSAPGRARGFRNLPGVDVVPVGRLGPEDLAPGGDPGRVALFSRAALEALRVRLGEPERKVAA
jgi:large subunit ribosomal protein L4e